jgi:3D (Asp-Asp-Asp) domain-containing protein
LNFKFQLENKFTCDIIYININRKEKDMKQKNIKNVHRRGHYLNPLFVTLLIIGLYITMALRYGKELDKLDKQLQQLTETHDAIIKSLQEKHNVTIDYYENLITIQRNTINKLYKEQEYIKKYMDDKVLLPLGEFEATAYDLSVESCGKPMGTKNHGVTATGRSLLGQSRSSARVIAVDPSIIPLNSQVYIEFDDKRFAHMDGIYTASDTGSAIKGRIIDIFMGDFKSNKTSDEVWEFGRRKVKVYKIKTK